MFRRIRWVLIAAGVAGLIGGGASIFSSPDHEVLYAASPPLTTCVASGCIHLYNLEIGNTGREPQAFVRVRLRSEMVQAALIPPTVRNFGKVDRPVTITEEGGFRIYDLGKVRPQERIELTLTLRTAGRNQAPGWDTILGSVEAADGEIRPGNPAATTLGRWFYAIFGVSVVRACRR